MIHIGLEIKSETGAARTLRKLVCTQALLRTHKRVFDIQAQEH